MTEIQLIAFGGVIALLLLRQPITAIVWILSIALNVLSEETIIPGIVSLIFVSIFLNFNKAANN